MTDWNLQQIKLAKTLNRTSKQIWHHHKDMESVSLSTVAIANTLNVGGAGWASVIDGRMCFFPPIMCLCCHGVAAFLPLAPPKPFLSKQRMCHPNEDGWLSVGWMLKGFGGGVGEGRRRGKGWRKNAKTNWSKAEEEMGESKRLKRKGREEGKTNESEEDEAMMNTR